MHLKTYLQTIPPLPPYCPLHFYDLNTSPSPSYTFSCFILHHQSSHQHLNKRATYSRQSKTYEGLLTFQTNKKTPGFCAFVMQDLDSILEVSQKQLFFYQENFNGFAHIFLVQLLMMFHTLIRSLNIPLTTHLRQFIILFLNNDLINTLS